VKPNIPMTKFENKMFSTVGNIGIVGGRLVNKQTNQIIMQSGGGGGASGATGATGYGPETLDICVNGAAGTIVVWAQTPAGV